MNFLALADASLRQKFGVEPLIVAIIRLLGLSIDLHSPPPVLISVLASLLLRRSRGSDRPWEV